MITLLLAASLIAVQDQPAPPVPDDVVVMGERMRQLKMSTRTDRKTGATRCTIKRSSGDPSFDTRMCGATVTCGATVRTTRAMEACLTPYIGAYVRELKEPRAAAGTQKPLPQKPSP